MAQDPIQNYAQRVQTFRTSYRAYNAKPRGPIAATFHIILTLILLLLLLILIIPILIVLFVVGVCLFAYFKVRKALFGPKTPGTAPGEGRENVRVIDRQ